MFLLFTFDYLDYPKKIFHNKKANNLTVDSANLNEICEYCIVIGDTSFCKISAQWSNAKSLKMTLRNLIFSDTEERASV